MERVVVLDALGFIIQWKMTSSNAVVNILKFNSNFNIFGDSVLSNRHSSHSMHSILWITLCLQFRSFIMVIWSCFLFPNVIQFPTDCSLFLTASSNWSKIHNFIYTLNFTMVFGSMQYYYCLLWKIYGLDSLAHSFLTQHCDIFHIIRPFVC